MFERHIKSGKIEEGMSFQQKVWALTARIPKGKIVTYADIAKALKCRGYRAVGGALNRNPYAPAVPCHRVVGSTGLLTGFAGGLDKKRKMLEEEGIRIEGEKVDLAQRFKLAINN
jgi:methylated-DNA-[protein]-cysteine S-methyltransferase